MLKLLERNGAKFNTHVKLTIEKFQNAIQKYSNNFTERFQAAVTNEMSGTSTPNSTLKSLSNIHHKGTDYNSRSDKLFQLKRTKSLITTTRKRLGLTSGN